MKENVFLIGYRGTGKTTVARLLADKLPGWASVDADEMLQQRAGKSIRQIFDEDGEPAFRDLEAKVLQELCGQKNCVVATGGGVVLLPDNRAALKKGDVVWLTADAATLWQRLQADATTAERRPALTTGGLAEIEELLRVRRPLYAECADLTIDTIHCSPEEVAAMVLNYLIRERSS